MDTMDARRLRLYELLKPKLDEEPARELVLALPAEPSKLVTTDHLDLRLTALEARVVERLTWRMITVLGAWTAIAAALFGWLSRVLR